MILQHLSNTYGYAHNILVNQFTKTVLNVQMFYTLLKF